MKMDMETMNQSMLEHMQNVYNMSLDTQSIKKSYKISLKRFVSKQLHKLKKFLNLRSNSVGHKEPSHESLEEWQNEQNERMNNQNLLNQELERRYKRMQQEQEQEREKMESRDQCVTDDPPTTDDEYWNDWDGCYMCATSAAQTTTPPKDDCQDSEESKEQSQFPASSSSFFSNYASICYVFMPGQEAPVPVKLRTTRIPGGAMWISYRPDLDIQEAAQSCCSSYTTTGQSPQPQMAI